MKKNFLRILSATSVIALVLCFSEGMTNDTQPPPGNSNDPPGNGSCAKTGCHSDNGLQSGTGKVFVTIGPDAANQSPISASTYTPGTTYTMQVDIQNTTGVVFGFQMIGLDNSNAQAGTFTVTNSTNTSLLTLGGSGKSYIGHKTSNATKTWTFQWTAPSSNVGPVTFFAIGNAANGNGNRSGDNIYALNETLSPATGIASASIKPLTVAPNPVQDQVRVEWEGSGKGHSSVLLTDLNGKIVANLYEAESKSGNQQLMLNIPAVAHGVYLLTVNDNGTTAQTRVIVK